MNTYPDKVTPTETDARPTPTGALGLLADWREMVFVHFRFDPAVLQPYVPLPLDLHQGEAYVSLLYFRLERMRPKGTGPLGRLAFRAISDHPFLNVRTYVRGPKGPGIFFVREWITNPLSRLLGPALYGLPYHCANFQRIEEAGGTETIRVGTASQKDDLKILIPTQAAPPHEAAHGSLDEFLVERYVAYTHRAGTTRLFHVQHAPWQLEDLDWVRIQADLLEKEFPWFPAGKCLGAQRSQGFSNVFMSPPQICRTEQIQRSRASTLNHGSRLATTESPG